MQDTLYIASDHAGFALKEEIKKNYPNIEWLDCGPTDTSRVDYPDYASRVATKVNQSDRRGILICGSGQGMAIQANRFRGVRAALVWNEESTKLAREHNNANILCLGARLLSTDLAIRLVQIFLSTPFAGGRHADRVSKLSQPVPENC